MEHVIACVDESVFANSVCDAAAWAAQQLSLPLHLLHCLERATHYQEDHSGSIGPDAQQHLLETLTEQDAHYSQSALEQGKHLLERIAQRAGDDGAHPVQITQRHGPMIESLIELQDQARLLVIGRSGADNNGQLSSIGAHVEAAVRKLHRPLLISGADFRPPERIMLAYDGTATADALITACITNGILQNVPCDLVMVKNRAEQSEDAFHNAERQLVDHGLLITSRILTGEDPAACLCHYQTQRSITLCIMGAFSHSRVRQFFSGSHTLQMIKHFSGSLLILQ